MAPPAGPRFNLPGDSIGGAAMRGDGGLYQRGNRWWYWLYVPGLKKDGTPGKVSMRASTGVECKPGDEFNRARAEKVLRAARKRSEAPTFVGAENEKATVGELLKDYRTHCEIMRVSNMRVIATGIGHFAPLAAVPLASSSISPPSSTSGCRAW